MAGDDAADGEAHGVTPSGIMGRIVRRTRYDCNWVERPSSALPPKADVGELQKSRYSITSSAAFSRRSGTSRPSAFAVFRLMINGTLTGIWIGRSPGFSPLRMRSMYSAACGYCGAKSGPYETRPPESAKERKK